MSQEPSARLIMHAGDLSYAVGAAHAWDAWFQISQPAITSAPCTKSIGNHERIYQETQHNANANKDPSGLHDGHHLMWGYHENDSNMPSNGNKTFWHSYD